ncbi:MAG: TolC family protein [Acidobacteriota bacterium]|nr:TolC family protein [Acidobacteriota bacterium]
MISTGMPAQSAPAEGTAQVSYNSPLAEKTHPFSMLGVWKPFTPHTLPQPVLRNTDRLHSLIHNGRMLLSLDDAVALVLENNFDIAIARYNLDIADTDILLARSGGTVRGVSTGVLSGTPGGTSSAESTSGTTGSGTGGTSSGTSGAGTGSGGIVSSTQNSVGSAIDSYDPTLTGTISADRATAVPQLSSSSAYYPIYYGNLTRIQQNTNQYNFQYNQGWSTGTLATVSFNNERITNNIPLTLGAASFYNPDLESAWKVQVRQHLLQGFGLSNNRREIVIAGNNRKVADASFRWQVISTVAQMNNIYWDLVNAYETLKVKQTALEFAERTLSDNQKQVSIGTLAPIEVVSAESSVATARQNLIVAQTQLQYQQLITKNAIARNFSDPELTAAEIVPTDSMALSDEPLPPVEALVNYALANRPDIHESELNLRNNEINNKAARNALLPTLDVVGYYQGGGQGGRTESSNSGYGDVFSQLVNRNIPDKGAYVSLTIPLRNRAAQASQIRSQLEYHQNQLNFQQQKNTVNLQVRNAAFSLQQAKAGVEAARAARDYAAESLSAEQKKFALGASTSYLVLQQQSNFTQKASDYIAALSTYEKARVSLEQVTATILDRNGIAVEDAARGQVTRMPNVPGLVPNQTTQPAK